MVTCGAALLAVGTLLVLSATERQRRAERRRQHRLSHPTRDELAIGLALAAPSRHRPSLAADLDAGRLPRPILGLALVLSPFGAVINGSRSWILIGGMSIQPAEFAKLGVVTGLALLLAEKTEARKRLRQLRDT